MEKSSYVYSYIKCRCTHYVFIATILSYLHTVAVLRQETEHTVLDVLVHTFGIGKLIFDELVRGFEKLYLLRIRD